MMVILQYLIILYLKRQSYALYVLYLSYYTLVFVCVCLFATKNVYPSSSLYVYYVEVAKLNANEWYFFSFRDRKYATGFRTNRATTCGYWKATGKDRTVMDPVTREVVGMRKTLVFYRNRAPNGIKTGWIMHEFRLETPHVPPKVGLFPLFPLPSLFFKLPHHSIYVYIFSTYTLRQCVYKHNTIYMCRHNHTIA